MIARLLGSYGHRNRDPDMADGTRCLNNRRMKEAALGVSPIEHFGLVICAVGIG